MGSQGDFSPSPLTLGRDFLTFVYLMINLDSGEFTLWPARDDATTSQLQAVDENNNPVEVTSCGASSDTSSSTPTSSNSVSTHSSASSSSNTGAIAGGVVGGIAGLVFILSGAWFFIRYRKKQNANDVVPVEVPAGDSPAYADKMVVGPNDHSGGNMLSPQDTASQGRFSELYAPVPHSPEPETYEVEG
jgi:hypothetical protein